MFLSPPEAEQLVTDVFVRNGVLPENAVSVAKALIGAEAAGQGGHGLRRVSAYVRQARTGKVSGTARPAATRPRPGVLLIDAGYGYAYPALDLAVNELPAIARQQGIAAAAIGRSHHAGVMGLTVERFAELGLTAMMVANAPASMAPWGGRRALFGTNPIAFAAPIAGDDPVVIDLALSKVARGKIMAANQKGVSIPPDWAFDREGKPTTDAHEALAGTMVPAGEAKGAALALMVEILAAGLTGANFAYEASSLFDDKGEPPALGHMLIVIDPLATAGVGTIERLASLAAEIGAEEGARLPGRRGQNARRTAIEKGIEIEDEILREIAAL